ncbi:SDR family oxidoreductase [Belnapia sp. T6]|uniref:SDR family oxidoreductase n=1 Tax=Belnapia mucosa TaxID=2804532 RepID=A0ABS1V2M6_9PROT|nr:SDR family oxidoreductase [Belnapia mucosa]MBL6455955.1 SDR family oxidoreductase [Belnapia mucosa]
MTIESRPVLLVTGGGRGIGAAVVRLAAQGHDLLFTYRSDAARAEATAEAARAAGARAVALQADIADPAGRAACFAMLDREFGRLDGLVNNAGITGPTGRLDETADEVWEVVLRTNVIGTIACCREAIRRMSTRHGGKGGAIVNVSSRASTLGGGGEWVHYAASKGAVDTLTIGLSRELATEGIRVNAVNPGLIDTELHAAAGLPDRVTRLAPGVPMQRGGSAEEVAEAVLWLLSDAARYVTGALLPVSGGR